MVPSYLLNMEATKLEEYEVGKYIQHDVQKLLMDFNEVCTLLEYYCYGCKCNGSMKMTAMLPRRP